MVIPGGRFYLVWRSISLLLATFLVFSLPISYGELSDPAFPVFVMVMYFIVDFFFMADYYLKARRWISEKMWKDSTRIRSPSEMTQHYFSMFLGKIDPELAGRAKFTAHLDSPRFIMLIVPFAAIASVMSILELSGRSAAHTHARARTRTHAHTYTHTQHTHIHTHPQFNVKGDRDFLLRSLRDRDGVPHHGLRPQKILHGNAVCVGLRHRLH